MTSVIETTFEVRSVELGCGHVIFMTTTMIDQRRRDHQTFYCTICGQPRHWPGESDIEKLRSQLSAAKQREETLRQQRINLEKSLETERRSKKRLETRISKGVCPCCNRVVSQLARHMKTKHPEYAQP